MRDLFITLAKAKGILVTLCVRASVRGLQVTVVDRISSNLVGRLGRIMRRHRQLFEVIGLKVKVTITKTSKPTNER